MRHVYAGQDRAYFIFMQPAPQTESKRRSHLTRRVISKRIEITDNDIRDIFEPLARHAQLSTRQLVAFGARHPVITKARLGELWTGRGVSEYSGQARSGDPASLVANVERLGNLGFHPRMDWRDGLAEYVAWFRVANLRGSA